MASNKSEVIKKLKAARSSMLDDLDVKKINKTKKEVYERFSPAFTFNTIGTIPESVLRDFLKFENNKHWSNLHRSSGLIFDDFGATRKALVKLLDDANPIESRMEIVSELKGVGHGIASAILHVSEPNKYGVWNGTSEEALHSFDLMPAFQHGAKLGDKYKEVNRVLLKLSRKLKLDLWSLDLLWDHIRNGTNSEAGNASERKPTLDGRERSIKTIVCSANDTVKRANGQLVQRKVKEKELRMTPVELETRVRKLLDGGGNSCAITGLPFQFEGEGEDGNMRPSLDRIDSEGHYESSNVQLVCRFVNFWKQATDDDEFRRLIKIVRECQN